MKIDIDNWDRLIGSLYETIARPNDLISVISNANRMMGSDFCHFLGIDTRGAVLFNQVTEPGHESTATAYAQYYGGIDPRRAYLDKISPGKTFRCTSLCDTSFVNRNEFYQDFLMPRGLRYVLGSCLHRDAHQSVYIAFNHRLGREDFTDEEERHYDRLLKHLQRAIQGILANAPIADAIKAGEDYLYRYQHGILGLTSDEKVSFANKQAEESLLVLPSQFSNLHLVDGSALHRVFTAVRLTGKPESCTLKTVTGTLYITALPFRSETNADGQAELKVGSKTKVLVLCGGQQQPSHTVRQLMQWFGFTAAEARLARDLAAGGSVEDYAITYSVSTATVRTQLRAVLQKSRTARQQDLIRLLLTLPLSS